MFSSKKVLLIGDVMLDKYIYGNAVRLSPEAPVPVLTAEREENLLGGAGTVLRNLASLGASTTFITTVGLDMTGHTITKLVGEIPRCSPYIFQERDRVTTLKTRHIAGHHQISRVDTESSEPLCQKIKDRALSCIKQCISDCDIVIISDYGKGFVQSIIGETLELATKSVNPKQIVIDPKSKSFNIYSKSYIITPNLRELEAATDLPVKTTENIVDRCRELIEQHNIDNILVTLGADGMLLQTKNNETHKIPSVAKEVYDVTGAGDTVVAVLALGVAAGLSLVEAAELANKAAGIVVGKMGSANVELEELCG